MLPSKYVLKMINKKFHLILPTQGQPDQPFALYCALLPQLCHLEETQLFEGGDFNSKVLFQPHLQPLPQITFRSLKRCRRPRMSRSRRAVCPARWARPLFDKLKSSHFECLLPVWICNLFSFLFLYRWSLSALSLCFSFVTYPGKGEAGRDNL